MMVAQFVVLTTRNVTLFLRLRIFFDLRFLRFFSSRVFVAECRDLLSVASRESEGANFCVAGKGHVTRV